MVWSSCVEAFSLLHEVAMPKLPVLEKKKKKKTEGFIPTVLANWLNTH